MFLASVEHIGRTERNMCFLYTYVLFFISITLGNSMNQNEPAIKSEGIFESFVRNYLDNLSTAFTGKQLIKYCKMMCSELKKMEFTYTEKLAKQFRYLSKMDDDEELLEEMAKYRREYDENMPKRQLFLQAMNEVFTLQHNLQFDDYIHEMLDLANRHILTIKKQTRKLLDMIVDCVDKLGDRDKRDLERKMRAAIKEYKEL
ncbi:hypothetical protein B5X24_HaOG208550 [Helicoverpa armigera]|nr:hypothetical protein B5X24_HaOG208550 [Helicoverpa armigera]